MNFDHAWVLFFRIYFPSPGWRGNGDPPRAGWPWLLKNAVPLAVILALAQPRLTVYESKVAVAVLVDTSASLSPADLAAESDLVTNIKKGRGRNVTNDNALRVCSTLRPAAAENARIAFPIWGRG